VLATRPVRQRRGIAVDRVTARGIRSRLDRMPRKQGPGQSPAPQSRQVVTAAPSHQDLPTDPIVEVEGAAVVGSDARHQQFNWTSSVWVASCKSADPISTANRAARDRCQSPHLGAPPDGHHEWARLSRDEGARDTARRGPTVRRLDKQSIAATEAAEDGRDMPRGSTGGQMEFSTAADPIRPLGR